MCSKPCKTKEYLIQQELQCCWICRKCLVNEYIENGTGCKACPFGQWPDEDTATYCTVIETTYLRWSSWITLFLTGIIIVGLFCTFYTISFYIINRHEKIIVTNITIVLVFYKVTLQSTHWSIQTLFISGGDSSCSWVFYSCTGPKCGVGVNLVDCNAVGVAT